MEKRACNCQMQVVTHCFVDTQAQFIGFHGAAKQSLGCSHNIMSRGGGDEEP